ncbi:hypothetical protein AGLY_016469 [Aphis glycines]|uniref:HAT C-terminal dimerisation domain-containing protein n=1 Tax=Aphis glycines TaxID=307491 RepID=A0A6G0SYA1_APHGL|nr:hypothetical protein AGLY_016469 [Aphis glycines]
MLIYYTFLNYFLPKFTILNKILQSDKPVLDTLRGKISELYKELLYSYYRQVINPFDVDPNNASFFKPLKDIYLGAGVYILLQKPEMSNNNDIVLDILNRCRSFKITACVEIKKKILPKNVLGNVHENSLLPFISLFPRILFINLSEFILTILSLPLLNCVFERLFSKVNLIKTKQRNKLMTDTLNSLINSKMLNSMTSNMYDFINNTVDDDDITFETE